MLGTTSLLRALRPVVLRTNVTAGISRQSRIAGAARLLSQSTTLHMRSDEYVASGAVVVDPVTGKKTLKNPMTVHDDLPDPMVAQKKTRLSLVVFTVVMGVSLFGIFNYEKVSSPVMNATMYFLRRSELARSKMGKQITFDGLFPWIRGELNTMKGNVDINVRVSGDKDSAMMYLKANRDSRMQRFTIERWELVFDDGTVMDLTTDASIDLEL